MGFIISAIFLTGALIATDEDASKVLGVLFLGTFVVSFIGLFF